MPETATQYTTAAALVALANELSEGGLEYETVNAIVFEAARYLVNNEGLTVRNV